MRYTIQKENASFNFGRLHSNYSSYKEIYTIHFYKQSCFLNFVKVK